MKTTQQILCLRRAAVLSVLTWAISANAAPPELQPLETIVVNDELQPIPVAIATEPKAVVCYRGLPGGTVTGNTSIGLGSTFFPSSLNCPNGVDKIQVHRIAYATNVQLGDSNAAQHRITLGFGRNAQGDNDPAGFLGMMTESAPQVPVVQDYVLDTTDTTSTLYVTVRGFAAFDTASGIQFEGHIYLIGIPVD